MNEEDTFDRCTFAKQKFCIRRTLKVESVDTERCKNFLIKTDNITTGPSEIVRWFRSATMQDLIPVERRMMKEFGESGASNFHINDIDPMCRTDFRLFML